MRHGETVAAFEREFANYVGAKYAIAMTNGTVTLEVALHALGIGEGMRVGTTPLTMAATSIAILNVGGSPRYVDVDPVTWTLDIALDRSYGADWQELEALISVSLYGLPAQWTHWENSIDDAAQTLKPHDARFAFTSYSFQRSKILSTGEGGMLVTNDEELAIKARSIASLGYDLSSNQSRIDVATIKNNDAVRHIRYPAMNARMNDATANVGLMALRFADQLKAERRECAGYYADAIRGFEEIVTPQYVPEGWTHDYWCYAVAVKSQARARVIQNAVAAYGSERPYAAWRLTYQEPVFEHLATSCPVAEDLQPRLLQFQTNDRQSAERNARSLRTALQRLNPR